MFLKYYNIRFQFDVKFFQFNNDLIIKSYEKVMVHPTFNSRRNLTSIEIPIVVGKNFAIGDKSNLFVEAGPYISYGLWGKSEAKLDGKTTSSTNKVFGKDGYNRFDYGFTLGIGANIASKWRIKCNYEFGIPNLMKKDQSYPRTIQPTYKNGCI